MLMTSIDLVDIQKCTVNPPPSPLQEKCWSEMPVCGSNWDENLNNLLRIALHCIPHPAQPPLAADPISV